MKIILGVIIGAAIGFGIGYFGRCASGACPLTSNPIVSTIIGALMGLMIAIGIFEGRLSETKVVSLIGAKFLPCERKKNSPACAGR